MLSKVGGGLSEPQKRQIIAGLPDMVIGSRTGDPWNDLKNMEQQSISSAVGTFGSILATNGSPNARKFLQASISEMRGISRSLEKPSRLGMVKRLLIRCGGTIALLFGFLYMADYLFLRYHISANYAPLDAIHAPNAVPKEDQKTMLESDTTTADHECVHSLFPHMGQSPCWLLTWRTDRRIKM